MVKNQIVWNGGNFSDSNGDIMTRIDRLRKEALQACHFRGHTMKRFDREGGKFWAKSKCKKCDKWVWLLANPLPNEIDISGTAISMVCNLL